MSTLPRYPYAYGTLEYAPGFQRYVDTAPVKRFEFLYPATYVQDQAVYLRNADRAYAQRTATFADLDLDKSKSRRLTRRCG